MPSSVMVLERRGKLDSRTSRRVRLPSPLHRSCSSTTCNAFRLIWSRIRVRLSTGVIGANPISQHADSLSVACSPLYRRVIDQRSGLCKLEPPCIRRIEPLGATSYIRHGVSERYNCIYRPLYLRKSRLTGYFVGDLSRRALSVLSCQGTGPVRCLRLGLGEHPLSLTQES